MEPSDKELLKNWRLVTRAEAEKRVQEKLKRVHVYTSKDPWDLHTVFYVLLFGSIGLYIMYSIVNHFVEAPRYVSQETRIERFILVELNPPKHVYVTLKNVETGKVFENVYISKHCNGWRDNKSGDEYNIRVRYVKLSDGTVETNFDNLYEVFC